jgi:hypothetical protein
MFQAYLFTERTESISKEKTSKHLDNMHPELIVTMYYSFWKLHKHNFMHHLYKHPKCASLILCSSESLFSREKCEQKPTPKHHA